MGGEYYSAKKGHNNNYTGSQGGPEVNGVMHRITSNSNETVNLPNGSIYTGERRNGKKHGRGI